MGGGGGGAPLVTQYWWGIRHIFLLTLCNLKDIGGRGGVRAPHTPQSLSCMHDRKVASYHRELWLLCHGHRCVSPRSIVKTTETIISKGLALG